jgi:hypothetical protein
MAWRVGIVAMVLVGTVLLPFGRAAAQEPSPPTQEGTKPELFQLNAKVGGLTYSYKEESSVVSSRYNGKVGLGEIAGSIRLGERFRFVLSATGALTGTDNEEATRSVNATGGPGPSQQQNDLSISLLIFEPDFRYRVLHNPNIDLDVILGWGAVLMTTERSNIVIDGVSQLGKFKESFTAHGPRAGASARFTIPGLPPKLSFLLEATYNNFMGVNVDSDFLQQGAFTRGYGVKWNVGFMYQVTPNINFGFGYQGMLLEFDRSDREPAKVGFMRSDGQVPSNTSRADAILITFDWKF